MLIDQNENDVKDKIVDLKKSFLLALKDFKKNYVNYKLNTDVDEYKNIFLTSKSQLQEINTQLYDLTEQIKNKIIINHNKNQDERQSLIDSKELYDDTLDKLENVKDKNRASNLLIDDYKEMYNKQFYKNFEIILGIIILSFITYKMKNI